MSTPPALAPLRPLHVGLAACAMSLALYLPTVFYPMLLYDDFGILRQSYTWPDAWDSLWLSQNEHAMPLGRLSTWALVWLAGRQSVLPYAAALQGPLAVVAGMGLLYLFVRRELGHPFYGLAAMALFGVSAVYQQAVYWFSASFSILTLDTLLLALLAAQRWRQTGRWPHLVLSAFWCALAPGWFASGVLAGPVCSLYLLPDVFRFLSPADSGRAPAKRWRLSGVLCLVPLLGTAAFLAVSLPHTGKRIQHLEHYGGQTAVEAFNAAVGLRYTGRSVVENLAAGQFGFTCVSAPDVLVPVVLLALVGVGVWWWRPVPRRRLLLTGLGLIGLGYFLVYAARAKWIPAGGGLNTPVWSRYHLLPQLGLALLIAGGLPRWQGGRLALDASGGLTDRQTWALLLLIQVLFVIQLPRALVGRYDYDARQGEALRRIEATDTLCRIHGIDGATARAALVPIQVYGAGEGENGWWMLRGSDRPRRVSVEEARRLLTPEQERADPALDR